MEDIPEDFDSGNKNPTRFNSMQIFIYCKVTLHVSGVKAPIIRSTKTVTAAYGTGHNIGTATSLQRDQPRGLVACLLIIGSRVRFPVLPCEFSLKGRIPAVTMVWVG